MLNPSKIRSLRSRYGFTQEDMAEKMNLSPTAYARLERGEVQPKIEKLQKLAEILQTDMQELLDCDDKSVSLSVSGNSDFSDSQAQAGWNFYHNHNNYYGSDALSSEIDRLQQALLHKDEMLAHLKSALRQKDDEIVLLRQMLDLLRLDKNP